MGNRSNAYGIAKKIKSGDKKSVIITFRNLRSGASCERCRNNFKEAEHIIFPKGKETTTLQHFHDCCASESKSSSDDALDESFNFTT